MAEESEEDRARYKRRRAGLPNTVSVQFHPQPTSSPKSIDFYQASPLVWFYMRLEVLTSSKIRFEDSRYQDL